VSAGDREAALDRLSQAFADGMLTADEHAELWTSAQHAPGTGTWTGSPPAWPGGRARRTGPGRSVASIGHTRTGGSTPPSTPSGSAPPACEPRTRRPAWKILTVGALLTCCLGVTWHGGVLFLGVPLLFFLIFVYEQMFYGGSDNAEKRQQAVFDDLGSALRRYDPSIREARVSKLAVNVSEVTVAVRFDNDRDTVPPLIIDEAVRLFWLSRLYPLKPSTFTAVATPSPTFVAGGRYSSTAP